MRCRNTPNYPVSEDCVTDVTAYLSPESRDFIAKNYPGRPYKAFIGVSPMGSSLCQEPVIIVTQPNGLQSQRYLQSKDGKFYEGSGVIQVSEINNNKSSWGNHARRVLVRGFVTPSERQQIIDLYEKEINRGGYRFVTYKRRPFGGQALFPEKEYQLVRTIGEKLSIQLTLSEEFEWKLW